MSETVVLTGATGFLGMEVLVRLLEQTDTEVMALVRARDRDHAGARMAGVYESLFDRTPASASRVTPLPGDVSEQELGLSAEDRGEILERATSIVHCAASISFVLPLEEAMNINAGGAARMLALARELAERGRLRRFVHVSTAYVGGRHLGDFSEGDLDVGQEFRNTYEQSKFESERVLRAGGADLPLVVARPSVVVGDSRSGWTPAFNVIYWPLRAYSRGLLDRVPVDPHGLVDIVPADYVADALLAIHQQDEVPGTVNLVAGRDAVSNAELMRLAGEAFDRPVPELGAGTSMPNVDEALAYLPYFDVHTMFDDSNARELLGPLGIRPPALQDYFPAIVRYAVAARWGKQPTTRETATRGAEAGPLEPARVIP